MSEQATETAEKPVIEDAYEAHVAKLREQRAQEPEEEMYTLCVSGNAMTFLTAACDVLTTKTPEMQRAKSEIESVLLRAVRDRIREQEERGMLPAPKGEAR